MIDFDKRSLLFERITYYDILAGLCYTVAQMEDNNRKDLYKLACQDLNGCTKLACSRLTCLSKNPANYSDINPNLESELRELGSKETENYKVLIGAIAKIDSLLPLETNLPLFLMDKKCPVISHGDGGVSDSFYLFDALNTVTKDHFGVLLPNLRCEWEKENARSSREMGMDPLSVLLRNYIWVPSDPRWKVRHLYCDIRNIGINHALHKERPPFRAVSSPICSTAPFVVELDSQSGSFFPRYSTLHDALLKERAKRIIDEAVEESADIVLFPEMMGTEELLRFCADYIADHKSTHLPSITILPSCERQIDKKWSNSLRILDKDGNCVFQYRKKHPFRFDIKTEGNGCKLLKYFEPIDDGDRQACVIHVPGIGRIGVFICSDVFLQGFLDMLVEQMKITLLLFPTFSPGSDQLLRSLSPAFQYVCDVLLCNTCAAWDDILLPLEKRTNNDNYDSSFITRYLPYGHRVCSGRDPFSDSTMPLNVDCKGTNCEGCLFITEFAKKYDGKFFVEHKKLEDNPHGKS